MSKCSLVWGHDRFVGRDDEHQQIDAADPGEHVFDESLVTGDIDEAQLNAVGNRQMREA